MPTSQIKLVGRDAELEAIDRFLSRTDAELPAALVIDGEAGIGKTVLWRATVERMRAAKTTVLTSAPTLGEAQLAFAGLADLVEEVWIDVAEELAGQQRTALEHALLLREGTQAPPDERGVAFGFLGLVRALAQTGPLAIAIDDIQWLDPSSSAMLRFAVRRLRHERVRFLLARRREEGADPDPLLLERADGLTVESVAVGSLTLGAVHRLLRGRLGHPLTRRELTRINAASHGNPLHALELARASESPSGDAPGSLPALMRARVSALPAPTRRILLLAALSADPSRTTLIRTGIHEPGDALAPAVEAELVTLDAGTVRFSHPLIASAVLETHDDDEHQRCHSLLAEAAETDEERARHLGRAATGADESIAAQLERAAQIANRRGARAVSAELYEEAAASTPAADEARRGRRLIEAGHAFFDVGDVARARALFGGLVDTLPEGPERVEARWRLGTVLDETGESKQAARVWQDALKLTGDRRLVSELERSLAYSTVYIGNIPDAARHAAASVAAAEDGVDSRPLAYALAAQALIGVLGGSRDYGEILQRALSLDFGFDGSLGEWSPLAVAAECGRLTGETEQTRVAYEAVLTRAIDMGEASTELWAAFGLTSTELLAGRLDRATELVEIVLDLTDQTGLMRIPVTGLAGNVAAHTGDLERARSLVVNALEEARATHEHMYELNLLHGLGFIESSSENHVAAAAAFERARRVADELGARHITVLRASFYEAEAAGNAGLHDQAGDALAAYGGAPVAPAWLEGVRLRAIGVTADARGDTIRARTTLEAALATSDMTAPLETARTELAYGSVLRRAREYSAARVQLERARGTFERSGAAAWLHQAGEELTRIPGRTRRADGGLTDAEQRIAELVASGSSNKEVAATLHLSVKTVEVTLTRVYRKLGVRSRSELAARFADRSAR